MQTLVNSKTPNPPTPVPASRWRAVPGVLASACLALGAASAQADSIPVGGPLQPGHARPPLHLNARPSRSVYYNPTQIRHAYGLDRFNATGANQTIAIVDAYGCSSVQKDLNTFCAYFGVPATTVSVYYPQGKPPPNSGWAQETDLDVQWAHAIAPGAQIVLVVAKSSSLTDLLGAVDYAVSLGASVVSMSWGGSEFSAETSYDYHFNVAGVTFVASSGDNGESTGVEWPAASPFVVSVGGTSLHLDSSDNRSSEPAWSGSGGGISLYETPLPDYQAGWASLSGRGVPDVSYVADPNTGVEVVYAGKLYVFGGTSVGAPQWAGLVALANSMRSVGTLNSANTALYSLANTSNSYTINPNYFFDITSGNNGSDPDDYAVAGYDLVTGLGSPVSNGLVPALSLK